MVTPWTVAHQAPLSMRFPKQDTGVGCHFLLQGIFLTQGSSPCLPCLLHCRQTLYWWYRWHKQPPMRGEQSCIPAAPVWERTRRKVQALKWRKQCTWGQSTMIAGRSNSPANDNLYFKNPSPLSRAKCLPFFSASDQPDEFPHIVLGEKTTRLYLLLSSCANKGQIKG